MVSEACDLIRSNFGVNASFAFFFFRKGKNVETNTSTQTWGKLYKGRFKVEV